MLSRVRASDFPKLDFESERAAENWMQLIGLKMSAGCPEVAEFWELTEREVRGKHQMYFRTPPMARGSVLTSAMLDPRFQPIERCFTPIVLDAVPKAMQKMAMNACLLEGSQLMVSVCVGAGPGSRTDRKQTLLRVQCPLGLNKKCILDNLFGWKFNLDRLLRMNMYVPDPSLQIFGSA